MVPGLQATTNRNHGNTDGVTAKATVHRAANSGGSHTIAEATAGATMGSRVGMRNGGAKKERLHRKKAS
jgi:hypothetical protein